MKLILPVFLLFLAVFLLSCGNKGRQSQSNITNSIDEEVKFAQNLYGDKAVILAKGDLLGNGRISAIAGIVKQKTDNSYWIEKASLFQKEKDGWQVILKMEEKLSSQKGELIKQVDAKYGYIVSFDTALKPVQINIVMANESGKASSDDGVIKWNPKINDFEFAAPHEEIPQ